MGHSLHIDRTRNLALFQFWGRIGVAEAVGTFLEFINHPDFTPDLVMLTDARGVTGVDAGFTAIFISATRLLPQLALFPRSADSIVLVADETIFGHVRILEQVLDLTSKIQVIPCWSKEEAMSLAGWPDLDFDSLIPDAPRSETRAAG